MSRMQEMYKAKVAPVIMVIANKIIALDTSKVLFLFVLFFMVSPPFTDIYLLNRRFFGEINLEE